MNMITNFQILKLIEKGGFGEVYLVKKMGGIDDQKLYAMKTTTKCCRDEEKSRALIIAARVELSVIKKIKNAPYLVKSYYCFDISRKIVFVMELYPTGDLKMMMMNDRFDVDERLLLGILQELVVAVEYLHGKFIIHRDIKPENILIDREGHVALGDYGVARCFCGIARKKENFIVGGNSIYVAPEIWKKRPYGCSVDWWSVGVLTYTLINKQFQEPFRIKVKETTSDLRKRVVRGAYKKIPCSPALSDLIDGLLTVEPTDRLGYRGGEVKRHNFFVDVNWFLVEQKNINPPLEKYIKPLPVLAEPDENINVVLPEDEAYKSRKAWCYEDPDLKRERLILRVTNILQSELEKRSFQVLLAKNTVKNLQMYLRGKGSSILWPWHQSLIYFQDKFMLFL